MLKQRVITALVLLAVLIPALLSSNTQIFMGLSLLLMTAGAWEWGRLNARSGKGSVVGGVVFFLVSVAAVDHGWAHELPQTLWWVVGAAWVFIGAWMLKTGVSGWSSLPSAGRWLCGLFFLLISWLSLIQAHARGVNFLLSVLALVWAADVVAYFSGRALGGKFFSGKLAPAISPGKTWEGAFGGWLGVLLLAGIWIVWDRVHPVGSASLHTLLWQQNKLLAFVAWAFLTMMSVVGDLVESLVKRSAGVKDSSALLPGHGGVLDRVDALLPVLPLAMMLVSWLEQRS